jgi:hypothetical protein
MVLNQQFANGLDEIELSIYPFHSSFTHIYGFNAFSLSNYGWIYSHIVNYNFFLNVKHAVLTLLDFLVIVLFFVSYFPFREPFPADFQRFRLSFVVSQFINKIHYLYVKCLYFIKSRDRDDRFDFGVFTSRVSKSTQTSSSISPKTD